MFKEINVLTDEKLVSLDNIKKKKKRKSLKRDDHNKSCVYIYLLYTMCIVYISHVFNKVRLGWS